MRQSTTSGSTKRFSDLSTTNPFLELGTLFDGVKNTLHRINLSHQSPTQSLTSFRSARICSEGTLDNSSFYQVRVKSRPRFSRRERAKKPFHQFEQAFRKCQRMFIVVRTLFELLSDLLEQKLGCLTYHCEIQDLQRESALYEFECRLKRELGQHRINDCFQDLHRAKRICSWICEEIKDELQILQTRIQYGDTQKCDGKAQFIQRWSMVPMIGQAHIVLTFRNAKKMAHVDVHDLLEGTISSREIDCVMENWPALESLYRSRSDMENYGLDASQLMAMMDGLPTSHSLRSRCIKRCKVNIKIVETALGDLVKEAQGEIQRRRNCVRRPCPYHNRDTLSHLRKVLEVFHRMRMVLAKARVAINQIRCEPKTLWDDRYQACHTLEVEILRDWNFLGRTGYGGLLTLKLEEVIELLVREPLWELIEVGRDQILKNISSKFLPV